VKKGGSLSFLVGTISNVLVMEIGWTDVGSEGYILFCQCFIGYLPCGGNLGCSAGNNIQLRPSV
jgi:hypothetical protein